MKRYLHKLSRDVRVHYSISDIESEQEVHVEHDLLDMLLVRNLTKIGGQKETSHILVYILQASYL